METILQLSRRMASPSSMDMKYSPTESLKLSSRDNKRIERRKPNWTEAENVFLLDQFNIHREILTCKATDASTNLKKQEIWRLICANLNQHNTLVRRTPAEVRRKWKNLVTAAKKEVWEMRHQIHLGGGGSNGRKISELSQRVLQLHSSGGFSSTNPNGLYGTLLSAGLIAPPGGGGSSSIHSISGDKYNNGSGKYGNGDDDKSYIPAHFTPIITLSESNNNHINLTGSGGHSGYSGDGPPSPLSEEEDDESSDSRNATEFMSDSGIYNEQEGIDLRVNVGIKNGIGGGGGIGGISNNNVGITNGLKGRIMPPLTNGNHHINDDPDEDEDDQEDDQIEDMSLIRFSSHLGLVPTNKRMNNFHLNNPNGNGPLPYYHHHHLGGIGAALSGLRNAGTLGVSIGTNNHLDEVIRNNKSSESTEEIIVNPNVNGDLIDATLKLRNHFIATMKESDLLSSLYKERLELQIEVLRLRKAKLNQELSQPPIKRFINKVNHPSFKIFKKTRRNGFQWKLKPKNTWMNIRNEFIRKEKEILDKSTNTEVFMNGNVESEEEIEKQN